MKSFVRLLSFCSVFFLAVPARHLEASGVYSRGMFVSVIQDPPVLMDRGAIESLVLFSKKAQIQTLFVQVYREGKAWFPSKEADSAPYQASLKSVGEDAFALLIRRAHEEGIAVHAWVNLLSLGANSQAPILRRYGPGILTRNMDPKKSLEDYIIGDQFFLEPGDLRVRRSLTRIIEEIVRCYPELDGVQLDYVRYPDIQPSYGHTKPNLIRFFREAGRESTDEQSPAWRRWKEKQVTDLVRELAKKARALHAGIRVSTTGLSPYYHAHLESFQNWRQWIEEGWTDFVTVMVYTPSEEEYRRDIERLIRDSRDRAKMNFAVGAYKQLQTPQVFESQWDLCEKAGGRGCVVFHYGSLLEQPALQKKLLEPKT